ncbi:hypothetical protein HGRIS_007204 [Hohenbuehelia grisea]|uniref:Enoyl reductase (ER) domain-containing protein n=1 Tax=Hohenbuehelia grisea TaxID=104357 RepID=A0ABR3JBD2_9AGAR
MSNSSDLKWLGYAIHDTKQYTDFKVIEFEPKRFEEYDIDVKIEYCGVCGSDVHSVTGGWNDPILPLIPGHEIIGTVVRVGPKVTTLKVGDRAGVGCRKWVDTYNAKYPNGDIAHGGYATAIRAHERYVFPIPEALSSEQAAPMLCGGLTVYSPLVRNGAGPGKKVGVVGVGGLGHFAIQFAKALGAEVYVFSHSDNKKADAQEMGADHFISTGAQGFEAEYEGLLDLIICTADISCGIPMSSLIKILGVHGRFIMVAIPDDHLPTIQSFDLVKNGALIGGSHIGSKKDVLAMLDLVVEKGVKAWIELLPMSKCGEAIQSVKDNHVRYRKVLKVDI